MGACGRVTRLSKLRGMSCLQFGDPLIRFRLQLLREPRRSLIALLKPAELEARPPCSYSISFR
jgi:hypothetical protein